MSPPRRKEEGDEAAISPGEFEALVREHIGLSEVFAFRVARLERGYAELTLPYHPSFLRPGGTLSGPTMMTLADTALYAAVLSVIGPVPLAVTTDLTFHFVRRPPPRGLRCAAKILKAGARLMVGEFHHYADPEAPGDEAPLIAFGSGSYSVPPGAVGRA